MNGKTVVMDQPLSTECSGQQGAATGGIDQPTGLNSPARMTGWDEQQLMGMLLVGSGLQSQLNRMQAAGASLTGKVTQTGIKTGTIQLKRMAMQPEDRVEVGRRGVGPVRMGSRTWAMNVRLDAIKNAEVP